MLSIIEFLNNRGLYCYEGYCSHPEQIQDLITLTNKPNINVMEIGFNAGHSSDIILSNNKELTLTSFDLGYHNYVTSAKEYIDNKHPNRHTLILGDSTVTVPQFINDNKDIKFDVIFIDGGHTYDVAKADINNCYHLAKKDTIVILDDTIFTPGWEAVYTFDPTKAWNDSLQENKIIQSNSRDYCPGIGMSWGTYTL